MTQAEALAKIGDILKAVQTPQQKLKDRIVKETLKSRIRSLPWYAERGFESCVKDLIYECNLHGFNFWDLVDEVGGFFAVRTIIHQLLVLKNGTRKMDPAATPGKVA